MSEGKAARQVQGRYLAGQGLRFGWASGSEGPPQGPGFPSPSRLDNATVLPTDPLGPGVIEDSYSDKFDTMACCKGDYNVFFRYGWGVSGGGVALLYVNCAFHCLAS